MDDKLIFNVRKENDGQKLNLYFRTVLKFSSRFTRMAVREGRVKVNSNNATLYTKLKFGDVIEVETKKNEKQNIKPQKMDLDIIYEDRDMIVVNKPSGMIVHPTKKYNMGTLSNGLIHHFMNNNENSIVRLVSRLDMNTSGLIICAKNQFAHMALARDMKKDTFIKGYFAVVHGNLENREGTIDRPIFSSEESIKRVIDVRGQCSITHYEVVESYYGADLVKVVLETGRTHQIRVHLSSVGHPIFGDSLYGCEENEYINRQALHAYMLEIPHPRNGEILKLKCELPEDIQDLIQKLKK